MEFENVIFSVSELNEYVSLLLTRDPCLASVTVRGEISGFKRHSSGHLYFQLKDENSVVRCVMFKSDAWTLAFRPRDGQKVVVCGNASLYVKDGSFQLYVLEMQQLGEGELYREYLELKDTLEKRGFFDQDHKKKIPFLPSKVGIVTSGSGAALQDILNIIHRRFPAMNIDLCPVRVQGGAAAKEIADGIRTMNKYSDCDVLIVGRGGGSIEDLWCFNSNEVAEAAFDSRIPIISAVGHETDYTILDFVADLRAPTPSAAAELAVPCLEELNAGLYAIKNRLSNVLKKDCESKKDKLELLMRSAAFHTPEVYIMNEHRILDELTTRMQTAERNRFVMLKNKFDKTYSVLKTLSPEAILERGFAIVRKADGTIAKAFALQENDKISVHFFDGTVEANVSNCFLERN